MKFSLPDERSARFAVDLINVFAYSAFGIIFSALTNPGNFYRNDPNPI